MTAGIPGIGLGGLFFVISALLMLVFEVVRTLQGRSSVERWRVVGYQSGLAAGIVLVTVGFLWLLELLVFSQVFRVEDVAASGTSATRGGEQALVSAAQILPVSAAPILVTLVLLLAVLGSAEVLGWIVRWPARASKPGGKKSG